MPATIVDTIHRWFEEVWNQGRTATIDELTVPHVVGHGQAEHATDLNLDQFRMFVQTLRNAFPDIRTTIHDTIVQGDKVVVRWTASMTHRGEFLGTPATGRPVNITGISIQRIVDGKIIEGWDNWDQLALFTQIGAVPAVRFVPDTSAIAG